MKNVTIYHNPKCGTSRTVLAALRDKGIEPTVIEYLKEPPSKTKLKEMIRAMGVPVRSVMRAKEAPYADLKLADEKLSDDKLIAAMVENPILINRPIVETSKGVRLCRPADLVNEIL